MTRLSSSKPARILLLLGLLGSARSGSTAPRTDEEATQKTAPDGRRSGGLLSERFGYRRLERLIASKHQEERLLAYAALARHQSPYALEKLARALRSASGEFDPVERLGIVRIAAHHADYRSLETELARILSEPMQASNGGSKAKAKAKVASVPNPRAATDDAKEENLVRQTAALALAAYGGLKGEQILLRALHQPGPAARAAALALTAHPTLAFALLQRDPRTLTAEDLEVLASRQAPPLALALERVVVESEPALQARALLALCRLGNAGAAPVAAYWLELSDVTEEQRRAALEILADSRHADWPRRAREGLASPSDRSHVLELLLRAPIPELVRELGTLVAKAPSKEAGRLVVAVARTRSAVAVPLLERWLREPRLAPLAAFALSELDMPAARRALDESQADSHARRWAFRGAVLSSHRQGTRAPELEASILRLRRSGSEEDRIDAAWAAAILQPTEPAHSNTGGDSAPHLGAAFAMPLGSSAARLRAARLVEGSAARRSGELLFGVLGDDTVMTELSQPVLEGFLARGGTLAAIAVTELARRAAESGDDRVAVWLSDTDPWFRMRVAKGLGLSHTARASALLEKAYARELEPEVREAIVEALGRHGADPPHATLALAERLDPSAEVRDAARRTRLGIPIHQAGLSTAGAWLSMAALASSSVPPVPKPKETAIRTPSGELLLLAGAGEALTVLTALPPDGYAVRIRAASD